jgi:hypothetical protein
MNDYFSKAVPGGIGFIVADSMQREIRAIDGYLVMSLNDIREGRQVADNIIDLLVYNLSLSRQTEMNCSQQLVQGMERLLAKKYLCPAFCPRPKMAANDFFFNYSPTDEGFADRDTKRKALYSMIQQSQKQETK